MERQISKRIETEGRAAKLIVDADVVDLSYGQDHPPAQSDIEVPQRNVVFAFGVNSRDVL